MVPGLIVKTGYQSSIIGMKNETHFASAARSSDADVDSTRRLLSAETSILDLLGAVSGVTAILDENRQVVYANEEFLKTVGIESLELVLGKRPGEVVSCIHSNEMSGGCGTSEACSVCGAVNAIIESQETKRKSSRETRITSNENNHYHSWDLLVTSAPITIRDRIYLIFTLQDISNEKRRQNLEKIFFHDILNSAGSLNGLLKLLKSGEDPEETRKLIELSEGASHDLLEEIILHRQLRAAEAGDLAFNVERLSSSDVLKSAVEKISHHESARNKRVIIVDHSSGADIFTDRILLQRVLINMLKNALEATAKQGTVYAEVVKIPEGISFRIKNDAVMPRDVQLQMFQRSFSTKGKGRGIGTYSIKLLAENYLKARVSFTSSETEGTSFFVDFFQDNQ
jgi:K+-sensing histidine kinase KdpD